MLLAGTVSHLFLAVCALASNAKNEARVTQIIREVKILPDGASARAATLNDRVGQDSGVRTGVDSRSELTVVDLTITRLGANTIFSFNDAGRNNQIDSGSILLRVPKDSGGGRVRSSAVTVAVTGTTFILETTRSGRNRLYLLEGSAQISLVNYPSEIQDVLAAQMVDVPPGATTIPPPVPFDLAKLMKTHPLIRDFRPLPSQDLIASAARQPAPAPPAPPPSAPRPAPLGPAPGPSGPLTPPIPVPPVVGPTQGGGAGGSQGTGKTPTPRPRVTPTPSPGKTPKIPKRPTRPDTGAVAGTNKSPNSPPQPTPAPVIPRTTSGTTRTPPATTTTGTTKSNTPRYSPPPKRTTKKPTPQNNGPR
jgi:hypothetical protein